MEQQGGDLVGRRLGHYRVEEVIGRGGMSTMYRATDVRLGRAVALKIMSDSLAGDAEFRERFVDEARNTSAIDHPHVVPLYDFGDLDGRLFLAMRYVEGKDLAGVLTDGPLAPRRTLALLSQVAEALDVLHSRKLVHLDVKPANVLVTRREGVGAEHAYLADFGLTRRGSVGHRTVSGDFLGSPTYAAPEHLRASSVDARTDVYSLACVLFACLTGHAPFTGSVDTVINGHLGGRVPAVSAEVVLPTRIDAVVRRGMATEPGVRPGSCRELMALAQQALAGATRPEEPPVRRDAVAGPSPRSASSFPPASPPPPASSSLPPSGPVPSAERALPVGALPPPGTERDVAAMRLRDPLPTRTGTAFTAGAVEGHPWLVPLVVAVVIALVVVVILLLV